MSEREFYLEQLEELCSTDDRVALHNIYCQNCDDYDDFIYSMDELPEVVGETAGTDPLWLICRVFYGDFNPNDDYFAFNGYGNLISFGYAKRLSDYMVDLEDIARDMGENFKTYKERFPDLEEYEG